MSQRVVKFPNSLREHRRLMGYSQSDIMRKLHLKSTAMISRWEQGSSMPNSHYLLKLSFLYKTLVNELYYELGIEYQMDLFPDETPRLSDKLIEDFPSNRGP